jgi:hypothetical protein
MIVATCKYGRVEIENGWIYVGVTKDSFLDKVMYDGTLSLEENIQYAVELINEEFEYENND